ncbi:MAG: hypothetical protein IKL02_08405 [Kiritimatiellae bacterium]|nr:hypothetical protein [Kiritimatiellia bacterium]MBR3777599.1 hypothetical protein [Kiritimatiellia bacterium]
MRKIISCVALVFGFIMPGLAAEIYVDSASSSQSPDGSVGSPYKTIAAAVNEANKLTGEESTVYVKGNYLIDGADDLVTVTAAGMTICAWGEEKPIVEISSALSANLNVDDPKVFAITEGADDCTIRNLSFKYYSVNKQQKRGNSLGKSGRIVSVNGHRCTVAGCEFRHEGDGSGRNSGYISGGGVIYNETPEGGKNATSMTVSDCWFEGVGFEDEKIVRIGSDAEIIRNVFKNCAGDYMNAMKQTSGGCFISNRVVNCSNPINTRGGNYNEIGSAEVAYNIFIGSTTAFICNNGGGMNKVPKIHHNTIVGCESFIYVEDMSPKKWTPWVFDNLIVLKEGGVVLKEMENDSLGSFSTSFVTQKLDKVVYKPLMTGNAYFAQAFSGGSATSLQGYDLYKEGLICKDNIQLVIAPEFLNTTDITSEDFYRINSTKYPWIFEATGAEGYQGEYIGAVPPKAIEAEAGAYFQIDDFAVEYDSLFAPVSATFTVGYSQNAGEVEVSWDFDGDGQYEQTGVERSVSYVYAKPGVYFPSVRVKDTGTGKILTIPLVSDAMIVSLENVYVDALADNGGDGSKEKPFRTICEGVAVCGENGVVYVKGGDDRVYNIVTADDLVQFNFSNVLLTQEEGFGRVKVNIDPSLNANVNNPSVITIAEDVNHVTIAGFDFTYYGNDNGEYAGQSLGDKGRVIDVYGDYATVSNCVFVQEGKMKSPSRGEVGHCAVATRATKEVADTREKYGLYLKVVDCRFEGRTPGYDMTTIMCGKDTEIINNVFTNCYWMYYPVKQLTSDFTFVSNRMVNCRSMYSNSGGYNELPNAEIAYNTFITEFGEPFLTKEHDGLHENVFIHHNTVVGSTNFVRVARKVRSPWRPKIYDNLIVLSAGSTLFQEDETEFYKKDGEVSAYSSFKTDGGAAFTNNVYMADNFDAGKALSLEGYDLSRGLKVENNTVIAEAPRFMSTDVNSPDFMRPRARKGDYLFSAAVGGYPNYVGAQEPKLRPEGMRVIIR